MYLNRNKVKIIAEVHPQHHGDMDKLKRMVLQCKIGGADYVKVQVYNSENNILAITRHSSYQM